MDALTFLPDDAPRTYGPEPGSEPPRRFALVRDRDVSGVSGTGLVAYGVMFGDGTAVTRWNSSRAQTSVWSSVADVVAIHGHGGATRLVWLDEEATS